MSKGLELKWMWGVLALSQLVSTAALAAPTCVFITGEVEGRSVVIPAVYVPPPEPPAPLPLLEVRVDPQSLTVLGYSFVTPEVEGSVDPQVLFRPINVPASDVHTGTPSISLGEHVCVDQGVEIPAFPMPYTGVDQETPGLIIQVPYLEFHAHGQTYGAGGQIIYVPGRRIIITGHPVFFPGVRAETPEETIVLHVNDNVEVLHFLAPPY